MNKKCAPGQRKGNESFVVNQALSTGPFEKQLSGATSARLRCVVGVRKVYSMAALAEGDQAQG
jgi:hypothetical protein